ncbi:MAG: hypothetical protein U9N86_16495 [Bacteroidota bacterium]|nr:hypothetical protein [Bacteroidota bacterium]
MEQTLVGKQDQIENAKNIIGWYTLVATATGAVPVPASSVAIVANNGFLIAHISSLFSKDIEWEHVIGSMGVAGTLNMAGRAVFVEAGKALAWGTGFVWALAGLSAVGAATAGLQTYIIGLITIEIAQKQGKPLTSGEAKDLISYAKKTYKDFLGEMKGKDLEDPGEPVNV